MFPSRNKLGERKPRWGTGPAPGRATLAAAVLLPLVLLPSLLAWGQAATPPTAPSAPPANANSVGGAAQAPTVSAAAQGGTVSGVVVAGTAGKPGGVPLPGVAVTATNTLTGRRYTAATDIDGAYIMKIPKNGRYVIRAELAGFAPVTAEVVLSGTQPVSASQTSNFGLQLASRVEAAEAQGAASSAAAGEGASPACAVACRA